MGRLTRAAPPAAALALVLFQMACEPIEPGAERVSTEMKRLQGQAGFTVVSDNPSRTVFAAQGREVVVEPAGGFCVERDSVDVSGAAAFALLSDCAPQGAARPFPGIVTISVSSTSMVDPGMTPADALAGMRQFLATDQGLAMLGRSGGPVRVEAAHDVGDGLYVLVEDGSTGPLPVLSPRFWRAFVELNGRMAMVTVSSFRENPLGDDAMLGSLARQVVALRRANRSAASPEEVALAGLAEEVAASARQRPVEVVGSGDFPDDPETPTASQAVEAVPSYAETPQADSSYPGPGSASAAQPAPTPDPVYAGPGEGTAAPSATAPSTIPVPESSRNPPYQGPASQG